MTPSRSKKQLEYLDEIYLRLFSFWLMRLIIIVNYFDNLVGGQVQSYSPFFMILSTASQSLFNQFMGGKKNKKGKNQNQNQVNSEEVKEQPIEEKPEQTTEEQTTQEQQQVNKEETAQEGANESELPTVEAEPELKEQVKQWDQKVQGQTNQQQVVNSVQDSKQQDIALVDTLPEISKLSQNHEINSTAQEQQEIRPLENEEPIREQVRVINQEQSPTEIESEEQKQFLQQKVGDSQIKVQPTETESQEPQERRYLQQQKIEDNQIKIEIEKPMAESLTQVSQNEEPTNQNEQPINHTEQVEVLGENEEVNQTKQVQFIQDEVKTEENRELVRQQTDEQPSKQKEGLPVGIQLEGIEESQPSQNIEEVKDIPKVEHIQERRQIHQAQIQSIPAQNVQLKTQQLRQQAEQKKQQLVVKQQIKEIIQQVPVAQQIQYIDQNKVFTLVESEEIYVKLQQSHQINVAQSLSFSDLNHSSDASYEVKIQVQPQIDPLELSHQQQPTIVVDKTESIYVEVSKQEAPIVQSTEDAIDKQIQPAQQVEVVQNGNVDLKVEEVRIPEVVASPKLVEEEVAPVQLNSDFNQSHAQVIGQAPKDSELVVQHSAQVQILNSSNQVQNKQIQNVQPQEHINIIDSIKRVESILVPKPQIVFQNHSQAQEEAHSEHSRKLNEGRVQQKSVDLDNSLNEGQAVYNLQQDANSNKSIGLLPKDNTVAGIIAEEAIEDKTSPTNNNSSFPLRVLVSSVVGLVAGGLLWYSNGVKSGVAVGLATTAATFLLKK